MPRSVPYSEVAKKYRPYLEVVFCNGLTGKCGPKTFGLIDSGADGIVIPYSLGREIGFHSPTAHELINPNIMTGIGGEAWHVSRDCQIHIVDTNSGTTHIFNERVSWIYPDPSTREKQTGLARQFEELQQARLSKDISTTTLQSINQDIDRIQTEIQKIDKSLEPDILLGRPFFDNFKYIKFLHHDRAREHECSFEYEINVDKVIETKSNKK